MFFKPEDFWSIEHDWGWPVNMTDPMKAAQIAEKKAKPLYDFFMAVKHHCQHDTCTITKALVDEISRQIQTGDTPE